MAVRVEQGPAEITSTSTSTVSACDEVASTVEAPGSLMSRLSMRRDG